MPAQKKTTTKVSTKAPSKKAAPVTPPEVKACKCAEASKQCQPSKKACKVTRVIVKYNAGWGNLLYIRGTGAGLDWNKGVLLQNIGEDEWLWEQLVPTGTVAFKVLVNDEIWALGEDLSVSAGDSVIVRPEF